MSLFFLRFGIGLITWRLADEGYFLAKLPTFTKKFSFAKLYRVLPKNSRKIVVSCNVVKYGKFLWYMRRSVIFIGRPGG